MVATNTHPVHQPNSTGKEKQSMKAGKHLLDINVWRKKKKQNIKGESVGLLL